ncbi:transcription factor 23 isoform X1 [Mauremys mutica]|uniref:transcription factor 23 isoform X1 n=1 Tax=Mauremys mutica TaxID=74926 RepID=UPI001D1664B8|nr:transcription factor 23 isoform X1 [Mauremys mutica]
MGADCPGWPGTSSTAGLGMAESTFAGAEGKRMETCSPRPASAPAGGKMRGSPGTPRLPPGWRRASQREVGSSQGASNAPSDSHSATGPLPAAGRGHASCALPRGSVGKLCPENAARERSRVRTLRQAFLALQAALPSVPPDTKLSKLDVLVLATSYIAHLTHTLHQGQPPPEAAPLARAPSFLHPMKKWPMRSRLYAGAWGADVADIPAAAPAVPSSRMRRACEGGSPGAGGAAL